MNSGRYLTPYQVERYPHFSALLRDVIGNKLSSTTATKSKEHERRSLLTNYVRARNDYETIKLVYDLVWDIITEKSSEEKYVKQLEASFLSLEMIHSMKIPTKVNENSDHTLNIFNEFLEYKELGGTTYDWVCSQLRQKIVEEGIMIMELIGKDTAGDNADLICAKLHQLPSLLSSMLKDAQETKKKQLEAQQNLMEQTARYSCVLLESLEIMEELIEKHMIEFQSEKYVLTQQSLKVQADALLLKIKSLYLEVLNETYTKETVPALKTISKHLDKQSEQVRSEIQSSRARINRYESVGQEFNNIVSEYTSLREAFKQKKWTLDKLKSYCP